MQRTHDSRPSSRSETAPVSEAYENGSISFEPEADDGILKTHIALLYLSNSNQNRYPNKICVNYFD